MKGRIYGYNVDIACEVGTDAAAILHWIFWWYDKNRCNDKHFEDGKYWTYNSIPAFQKQFPNLSERQIQYALTKLKEKGFIFVKKLSDNKFDKTNWYSVTEKTLFFYDDCTVDDTNLYDRESKNESSYIYKYNQESNTVEIPVNKTNNGESGNSPSHPSESRKEKAKQNKEAAEEMFLDCWKKYPRKLGKGGVSDTQKLKLYKNVGKEQLLRCIERFIKANKNTEIKYMPYGSTFFNSTYEDYLDENVSDSSQKDSGYQPDMSDPDWMDKMSEEEFHAFMKSKRGW